MSASGLTLSDRTEAEWRAQRQRVGSFHAQIDDEMVIADRIAAEAAVVIATCQTALNALAEKLGNETSLNTSKWPALIADIFSDMNGDTFAAASKMLEGKL